MISNIPTYSMKGIKFEKKLFIIPDSLKNNFSQPKSIMKRAPMQPKFTIFWGSKAAYEKLFFDIAQTYKKAVQEFYDIGCRYLQMDDIFFAYLCDPNHRTTRMKFGEDPDELIEKYAWMLNEAIKDRPKDMTVGMHLCRGNFKSNFAAQGAYDPTVDAVFNKIDLDVYFMEYDDERSGGLEPLKYLPKGNKRVMPGFITTKQGKLETLDFLKKKFEEASKYISIDQLGIAPQCGFSSTEEGNIISLEDQKRKLELVIEASNKIWGE